MAVVIDGTNTPTAGGVGYGDGTELAFTSAGSAGQVLTSAGSGTPSWQDRSVTLGAPVTVNTSKLITTGTAAANPVQIIALDANRDLILFGGASATTDLYGIIYDSSTDTFGSAALIRSGAFGARMRAILISSGTVLVASGITTALQGVVLTTSGTTLTVNSATSVTLAASSTAYTGLIAVGSTYVLGYYGTGHSKVIAMTVSGTTVTFGSETSIAAVTVTPALRNESASTFLVGYMTGTATTSGSAVVVSVSGTTLTVGTPQNNGSALTNTLCYFKKLSTGRYAMVTSANNTALVCSIITVSGTSLSFSNVSIASSDTVVTSHFGVDTANQVLFYNGGTGVAVLTDTSGTASASALYSAFSVATGAYVFPLGANIYGTSINSANSPIIKASISGSDVAFSDGFIGDPNVASAIALYSDQYSITSWSMATATKTVTRAAMTTALDTLRLCITTTGTYYFVGKSYGTVIKEAYITDNVGGWTPLNTLWVTTAVTPSSTHYFTKVTLS